MESGSNKSLFTLIAVVIFGVFLSLSYWLFQDELVNVLASVMDSTSEMTSIKLENKGLIPTDVAYFTYHESNGEIMLTSYDGNNYGITDVVIPAYINGLPVTSIGEKVFYSKGLTSLVLPETLVTISDSNREDGTFYKGTFSNNPKLKKVVIPDSVTYIGTCAFRACGITDLRLGNNLLTIKKDAFTGSPLGTVDIPDSVLVIEEYAFAGCNIKSLTLGSSLKYIARWSFQSNKITTLEIPESVYFIGNCSFMNNNLKEITIPKNVTTLGTYFAMNNPLLTEVNLSMSLKEKVTTNTLILAKTGTNTNSMETGITVSDYYSISILRYY